jgi:pimeloyl-ACP methyl ester carboxylesterase
MPKLISEPLPVILVPGLLCSARLYAAQIDALWPFGPVTVADHRRDDSVDAIARRILAEAPPRFALAGLSMGGYIAFAMWRQAPDRIERLALLDTSARNDTPEQTERRRGAIAKAEAGQFDAVFEAFYPALVHKNRHGDAELKRTVRGMADATGVEAFIRQQKAIMGRPDMRPELAKIRCKTLVLVGEGDDLTPPPLAQEIAAGIPGAQLAVIPDSGHLSTLERPEPVTQALVEWMH